MANVGTLNMQLLANASGFRAGLSSAGSALDQFRAKVQGVASGFQGQLAGLLGAGAGAGFLGWGVKLAADAETAQVAFSTMLGSATDAKRVLGELRQFAESTPFEFPELRDAARSLLAFGIDSRELVGTLRMIGDVSSGVGQPIKEIAELYGKARVQGRLFAEDINQFQGRGINVAAQFAQQLGVSESAVRKLVESGQVSFANLQQAFEAMTSSGGRFAGMMSAQSQTLAGRFSTLKDNVASLAMSFGEALLPAASNLVDMLSPLVQGFASLDASTRANVVQFAAFAAGTALTIVAIAQLVKAIQTIVAGLRAMAIGQAIVQALSGPKGWAALAGAALVAAGAVAVTAKLFDDTARAAAKDSAEAKQAADQAKAMTGDGIKKAAAAASEMADSLAKVKEQATEADDAAKRLADMMERGKQIAEQYRTPGEVLRDTASELSQLLGVGAIGAETFRRAMADAREKAAEARGEMQVIENMRKGPGGAFGVNTREGFSAIQESLRNADADRMLAARRAEMMGTGDAGAARPIEREALGEAKRQREALEEIQRSLAGEQRDTWEQIRFDVARF